jgi:hypothetical protein
MHIIEQGPEQVLANILMLIESLEKVIEKAKGAALIGILDDIG